MLANGQVDMVTDATFSPERLAGAKFLEVGRVTPALVMRAQASKPPSTIPGLIESQLIVASINGYDFGKGFRSILTNPAMSGRVAIVNSTDSAAKMLMSNRIDAILTSPISLVESWQKYGEGEMWQVAQVDGMPSLPFGLYFSTTKMSSEDIDVVGNALKDLIKSGEVFKLSLSDYPEWIQRHSRPTIPKK